MNLTAIDQSEGHATATRYLHTGQEYTQRQTVCMLKPGVVLLDVEAEQEIGCSCCDARLKEAAVGELGEGVFAYVPPPPPPEPELAEEPGPADFALEKQREAIFAAMTVTQGKFSSTNMTCPCGAELEGRDLEQITAFIDGHSHAPYFDDSYST